MKKIYLSLMLACGVLVLRAQIVIDFETSGDGYTSSTTEGTEGSSTDIFNRTNPNIGGNSSFIWGVEDTGVTPATITLDQIDVSGESVFNFAIDLLTTNSEDWDSTDELLISYTLDGGVSQNLMWVQHLNTDDFNNPAAIDRDFDGNGDEGELLPALVDGSSAGVSSNFQTFETTGIVLAGNSTLDILLTFNGLTSTAEGIYLDDIEISFGAIVPDPEPSNQPTAFAADSEQFDEIVLSWTDATAGAQEPEGYVIFASTTTITAPTDGIQPTPDSDLSDGSAVVFVSFGASDEYTFNNLDGGTAYNFSIYSYTNTGASIDFKLDAVPSSSSTTPDEIWSEDFEEISTLYDVIKFSTHDIDESDTWYYDSFSSDSFAEMDDAPSSSVDGTGTEEDYMIFGPFNMEAYTSEVLSFFSTLGSDANGTPLSVLYSTDFNGDPSTSTWTTISAPLSTGSFTDTFSGVIDISAISGQAYIAFYYQEDEGIDEGNVQIDDIKLSGTKTATIVTTLTSSMSSTDLELASSETTTGDVTVNDLLISSSSTITVSTGHTLTVLGDLDITDGSIIVESGGSLLTYGQIDLASPSNITIEKNTTFSDSEGRYSMVGSPVAEAVTSSLSSWVYTYDEVEDFGADGADRFNKVVTPETMVAGKGYFSAFTGDVDFVGTPNNGGVTVALSYTDRTDANDGWQLVSNPYPSSLDFSDFIDYNTGIEGSIAIWDDGDSESGKRPNSDYLIINAMGSVESGGSSRSGDWDEYIRSGQGFFVKSSEATDLHFTNHMRIGGNNSDEGYFRKSASQELLRISMSSGDFTSQTLLGLTSKATLGLDRLYDASKLKGNNNLQVYSKLNDKPLSIQGLPFIEVETIVDLEYDLATAGVVIISFENTFTESVFLLDTELDKVIDLSQVTTYQFTSSAVESSERFKLVLRPDAVLGLENITNTDLTVFSNESGLNILTEKAYDKANVKVYTINGSQVLGFENVNLSNKSWNTPFYKKGIFIMRIETAEGVLTKKFLN